MPAYRGRIAPTPTGYLHAGHAVTFWTAYTRARTAKGSLVFRMEDLDPHRCKSAYADAALEDLGWLGIRWNEGPDVGGPFGPYEQSRRYHRYLAVWHRLKELGVIYPCTRSRRDVEHAAAAPHGEAPIFPRAWRGDPATSRSYASPDGSNWRFVVPDGEAIAFKDRGCVPYSRTAGVDFGDFLVWRRDGVPAYELAVVVDDIAMEITEVVRGEDLLCSTCRQLLIYRALGVTPPAFYHCPLVRDASGRRLAKRDANLGLRDLRKTGHSPHAILKQFSL